MYEIVKQLMFEPGLGAAQRPLPFHEMTRKRRRVELRKGQELRIYSALRQRCQRFSGPNNLNLFNRHTVEARQPAQRKITPVQSANLSAKSRVHWYAPTRHLNAPEAKEIFVAAHPSRRLYPVKHYTVHNGGSWIITCVAFIIRIQLIIIAVSLYEGVMH
ncbi:hypothetical protein K439DRAFT_1535851 [Ramaria rubella]|nr:hypothetical protein K439DRAFT_1535851 [Ramaria rubella]